MDFKQIIRKKNSIFQCIRQKDGFRCKKKKKYIQSVDWAVKTVNKNVRVWLNRNIFNYIIINNCYKNKIILLITIIYFY